MVSSGIVNTNVQFISATTPNSTGGDIVLRLISYDSSEDVDLSLNLTLVSSDLTEIEVAESIEEQLITLLADYEYSGTPTMSNRTPPSTFRVHRTDHIVTVWSQASFEIRLTTNETDVVLNINSSTPALSTCQYMRDFADIEGLELVDLDGNDLTDEQLTLIIVKYSAQLISELKHFVVLCTYVNEFSGNNTKHVFTRPTPGVSRDPLTARQKASGWFSSEVDDTTAAIAPYPSNLFVWTQKSGKLEYRPFSPFTNQNLPWRTGNEVRLTIQAGYRFLPEAVKMAVTQVYGLESTGEGNFKSLAGGSFKLELADPHSYTYKVFKTLAAYKSK